MARWSDFIEAFQLVNEFKAFPAMVGIDIDLDAVNLWWDKVGTPTTAVTMVDVAGEAITETYEYALKTVTDAASEGLSQTWTYADEPRAKSGRTLSAICAIWSVGGLGVSAKLVNSDTSETAGDLSASMAQWTIVKIEGHVLAGTSCTFRVTANGAGTFYVVPLGACIGPAAMPLGPRPLRFVEKYAQLLNGVDPGGASWTDVDITANTSPLAAAAHLVSRYDIVESFGATLSVRRNGDSTAAAIATQIVVTPNATYFGGGTKVVLLDDAQVFEYVTGQGAGITERVYISLFGYEEWA